MGDIFSSFSRNSLLLMEERDQRERRKISRQQFLAESFLMMEDKNQRKRRVEISRGNILSSFSRNSFLLMEDRDQRERRVEISRGTYSVVSHGKVSLCWKTGPRE